MAEASEIIDALSMIKEFASSLREVKKAADADDGLVPNPLFLLNGFEGKSPKTKKNLFKRKLKAFGSTVFSAIGSLASSVTMVNAADIAKHGAATGSSAMHLYKLRAMAEKVKDGGSLRRHLDVLVQLKAVKVGSRGAQTVVACIPVPGVSMIGTAASMLHEKVYIRYMKAVILSTATRIHWQAYCELKLLRGSTTHSGPALRMIRELVGLGLQDGMDFGDLHSVAKMNEIIMEPAGYLVIVFKLEQT